MCLGLALLMAAVSPATAQTLLDAVLYLAIGLDAHDIGERKVTVIQDDASLDAKVFLWTVGPGNPGRLVNDLSISVRRIADCRFEVDFASPNYVRWVAHYSLDFSSADFAGAYFKDDYNETHSLVIPGATWCRFGGSHFTFGKPSCTGGSAVLGALGRNHDDKTHAAIAQLERYCPVKVSRL